MEVTYAHLCDYAIVSQEGKISIMGIFDAINAPQVPATHPQMFLAFQISADYAEVGRDFTVEVQIVDEDGRQVWGVKGGGKVQPPVPVKPGERTTLGHLFAIQAFTFSKFGPYDVNIFLNGQLARRVQLRLNKFTPPPSS